MARRKVNPVCGTCSPIRLPYIAAHADAERRAKKGQTQSQCPECGLWRWPGEFRDPDPWPRGAR